MVGTLWQVEDETCVKVAQRVYEELARCGIEDDAVYRGLHWAVIALRDEWVEKNLRRDADNTATKVRDSEEEGEEELAIRLRSMEIQKARAKERGERDAKVQTRQNTGRLFKADWIPFVHYGT